MDFRTSGRHHYTLGLHQTLSNKTLPSKYPSTSSLFFFFFFFFFYFYRRIEELSQSLDDSYRNGENKALKLPRIPPRVLVFFSNSFVQHQRQRYEHTHTYTRSTYGRPHHDDPIYSSERES